MYKVNSSMCCIKYSAAIFWAKITKLVDVFQENKMEYSRNEWDFFLWPRTWHNRLNSVAGTLVPGIIIVGLFDMLTSSTKQLLRVFVRKRGVGIFSQNFGVYFHIRRYWFY
jgi:hypothetical protein